MLIILTNNWKMSAEATFWFFGMVKSYFRVIVSAFQVGGELS